MLRFPSHTFIGAIAFAFSVSPSVTYADCDTLLTVGIYNISQSSSASEGEAMAKSTFCEADYSLNSTTSSQQQAIKASFLSWFSGGASGSVTDQQVIETQKNVCTLGFSSSAYSNQASSYSKTVYQGVLDAWNQCNLLETRGLNFDVQADNTMEWVAVTISAAATGTSAKFIGLSQVGLGSSVCTTVNAKGKIITLTDSTPLPLNSANKLTAICKRNLADDGTGNLSADAQSLIFNTSTGAYQVPLSGIGSLSHSTVQQVIAQIASSIVFIPSGTMAMWPKSTPPSGWLEANGQSTNGYPTLAAVYGSNLPDMRGVFPRGWDNGRGLDPNNPPVLGYVWDQFKSHSHSITDPGHYHTLEARQGTGGNGGFVVNGSVWPGLNNTNIATTGITINNSGGTETAPKYMAWMFIIKI
jgi:hypothetical protein